MSFVVTRDDWIALVQRTDALEASITILNSVPSPSGFTASDDSEGETQMGDLQLKWGNKTIAADTTVTITLTSEGLTAFDNACLQVIACGSDTGISSQAVKTNTLAAASFKITNAKKLFT